VSCYGMTEAEWRSIPELERGAIEAEHYRRWVEQNPGIHGGARKRGSTFDDYGPGLAGLASLDDDFRWTIRPSAQP
jgi:hypothetical protein